MKIMKIEGEDHKQCTHDSSFCENEWLPLTTEFFRTIGDWWDNACILCRNRIKREKYHARKRYCDILNMPKNEQMAHYILSTPPWKANTNAPRVVTGIFGNP